MSLNTQSVLLPNEIIQITVRAYIDNALALILNQGPRDLSATLILHTVLGKDHFISASGEYR
jgi:inositol polyphosphate 5-phosphatase INPP5B/F